MTSFLDSLFEPDRRCSCGHHEGSHNHGFTHDACMWCACRGFLDSDEVAAARRRHQRLPIFSPR